MTQFRFTEKGQKRLVGFAQFQGIKLVGLAIEHDGTNVVIHGGHCGQRRGQCGWLAWRKGAGHGHHGG
jgi:hypothetical protein